MFGLYNPESFKQNVELKHFIEIGVINRCKDFKEIRVYLGKKYNDIFIPFENNVYICSAKRINIENTISFFYKIDKSKIILSTYKCIPEKKVKILSKVLKWTWKDLHSFTPWMKVDFLHF